MITIIQYVYASLYTSHGNLVCMLTTIYGKFNFERNLKYIATTFEYKSHFSIFELVGKMI